MAGKRYKLRLFSTLNTMRVRFPTLSVTLSSTRVTMPSLFSTLNPTIVTFRSDFVTLSSTSVTISIHRIPKNLEPSSSPITCFTQKRTKQLEATWFHILSHNYYLVNSKRILGSFILYNQLTINVSGKNGIKLG